ncbi:MAG: hypothetical protein EWV62_23150 [Microcystis aeruginosa Ma_OC_LR_19540900_S633]|nr:MAG: hypothetical protein EWV62_23150 [Microcystis aeruginosa Ma_OC_LR_19540900_S633]
MPIAFCMSAYPNQEINFARLLTNILAPYSSPKGRFLIFARGLIKRAVFFLTMLGHFEHPPLFLLQVQVDVVP